MPKENEKRIKTKKITYFDNKWLVHPAYSQWLKRLSDNTRYGCKVCNEKKETRTLKDIGEGALKKHANTQNHKKNLESYLHTKTMFIKCVIKTKSNAPVAID